MSGFGDYRGWIPRWGSLWVVFPSISAPHFVSVSPLMGILIPLLRRIEISILWTSFFLSFIWSVNCVFGILSFGANPLISECIPCVFFCDWVTSLNWWSLKQNQYCSVKIFLLPDELQCHSGLGQGFTKLAVDTRCHCFGLGLHFLLH